MNIAENITKLREANGISKSELARRLEVAPSMVTQMEKGTKTVSLQAAAAMTKIFNCKIDDLIGE